MANPEEGRYYLKSVHEEIDLFDRKLAHLTNYGEFGSDAERADAAKKMNTKRETLAKKARQLAADGVEFKPNELPRSFRPKDEVPVAKVAAEEETKKEPVEKVSQAGMPGRAARRQSSAYQGTSLDWEKNIREYMAKK